MPRLNGKFVSQATYDQYTAEENTVTVDTNNLDSLDTDTAEVKVDGRHGVRPTTLLKRALIAEVNAEIALSKAEDKLATFEAKGQSLRDAVEVANIALNDATQAVADARANV